MCKLVLVLVINHHSSFVGMDSHIYSTSNWNGEKSFSIKIDLIQDLELSIKDLLGQLAKQQTDQLNLSFWSLNSRCRHNCARMVQTLKRAYLAGHQGVLLLKRIKFVFRHIEDADICKALMMPDIIYARFIHGSFVEFTISLCNEAQNVISTLSSLLREFSVHGDSVGYEGVVASDSSRIASPLCYSSLLCQASSLTSLSIDHLFFIRVGTKI